MAKKKHQTPMADVLPVPPPSDAEKVDQRTKFTPETRKKILSAIQSGVYRYQACALAGVNRRTLRDWELRAEAEPDGEHAEFVAELERVQFAAEAHWMAIHNMLAVGGKLPASVVEELSGELGEFRQRNLLPALQAQLKYGGSRPWAEIQKFEHTGKDGAAIEIKGPVTPEAAASLLREAFGDAARKAKESADDAAAAKDSETKP